MEDGPFHLHHDDEDGENDKISCNGDSELLHRENKA
jgi:hypothetical protein